jgi:hypothetical protein
MVSLGLEPGDVADSDGVGEYDRNSFPGASWNPKEFLVCVSETVANHIR